MRNAGFGISKVLYLLLSQIAKRSIF